MKNLSIAVFSFFILAGSTSCKKTYTCSCVYPSSSIQTSKTTFKTTKKSDAQTSCDALSAAAKAQGGACGLE